MEFKIGMLIKLEENIWEVIEIHKFHRYITLRNGNLGIMKLWIVK